MMMPPGSKLQMARTLRADFHEDLQKARECREKWLKNHNWADDKLAAVDAEVKASREQKNCNREQIKERMEANVRRHRRNADDEA